MFFCVTESRKVMLKNSLLKNVKRKSLNYFQRNIKRNCVQKLWKDTEIYKNSTEKLRHKNKESRAKKTTKMQVSPVSRILKKTGFPKPWKFHSGV